MRSFLLPVGHGLAFTSTHDARSGRCELRHGCRCWRRDLTAAPLRLLCLLRSPGATLTSKEKLEIAKKLSQLGER